MVFKDKGIIHSLSIGSWVQIPAFILSNFNDFVICPDSSASSGLSDAQATEPGSLEPEQRLAAVAVSRVAGVASVAPLRRLVDSAGKVEESPARPPVRRFCVQRLRKRDDDDGVERVPPTSGNFGPLEPESRLAAEASRPTAGCETSWYVPSSYQPVVSVT